jgi:hypothetical protein
VTDGKYEFCQILVKNNNKSELEDQLAAWLGGVFEHGSMSLDGLIVDVVGNSDGVAPDEAGHDFVRWPVQIEFEAEPFTPGERVVELVSRVLKALWESGRPAVAACDFEDELPWGGGIQRL